MFRINVSGGEFFELIRPSALVLSALLSTWVLASALKRYSFLTSLLWAIATFFLPLIAGPLYLAFILVLGPKSPVLTQLSKRWFLSLTYAGLILAMVGFYLISDKRSADDYIVRATLAKLKSDHTSAIKHYRSALKIENNAHTHKLLAIELAEAGMSQEAISEFRLAESAGEPDESISYQLGILFEKLNHREQAATEYRKFLASDMCTAKQPDVRCQSAEIRLKTPGD